MASRYILAVQEDIARKRLAAACEVARKAGVPIPDYVPVKPVDVRRVRELEFFASVIEALNVKMQSDGKSDKPQETVPAEEAAESTDPATEPPEAEHPEPEKSKPEKELRPISDNLDGLEPDPEPQSPSKPPQQAEVTMSQKARALKKHQRGHK